MSDWKAQRAAREAAEKAKRDADAAAKAAKVKEELGDAKERLERERRERDARDEAAIAEHQRQLAAAGVADKETAVAKADAIRRASEPCCFKCGQMLKNSGKFTRIGPLSVPYEKREKLIHNLCLQCDRCGLKNPGIEEINGQLVCFQCANPTATIIGGDGSAVSKAAVFAVQKVEAPRATSSPSHAPAAAKPAAAFCSECGTPRKAPQALFCAECGNKY